MQINCNSISGKSSVKIHIDFRRLQGDIHRAQMYLDNRVLMDSERYIPIQGGALRSSGIRGTVLGSGKVIWNTLYAHYQYVGRLMVGKQSRSAYAKRGEPKEYKKPVQKLKYAEPEAKSEWFATAKRKYLKSWERGVGRILYGK